TKDADRPTSVSICTDRLHAVAVDGILDRRLVTRASGRSQERGLELALDLLDARCIDGEPRGRRLRVAEGLTGRFLAGHSQPRSLAPARASIGQVASDDVRACLGDGLAHRRIPGTRARLRERDAVPAFDRRYASRDTRCVTLGRRPGIAT